MTRELSPAERATVERFEQAPDALAEAGCVPCEVCGGSQTRGWHRHENALTDAEREALGPFIWGGWIGVAEGKEAAYSRDLQATVERIIAARVAEAADAREADVRERVGRLADARPDGDDVVRVTIRPIPTVGIGEVTRTYVSQSALRAALAPADNDGEACRG